MKALVLGGTGSISREIVEQLVAAGHETTVYNRGQRETGMPLQVKKIIGDRFNYPAFEAQMAEHRFDVVFDMISYTAEDMASALRAFDGRTGHLIVTSSIACYKRPFRKMPPIPEEGNEYFDDPSNAYGYNKALLEQYLFAQIPKLKDLKVTVVRPCLTFGKGGNNLGIFRQNYGLVQRMRDGKPVVLFGDGQTPMSFSFTPDVARGYVLIAGNPKAYGQVYHLNSMEYTTWQDLYQTIGRVATGKEPEIVHIATDLLLAAAPELNSHLYHDKQWVNLYDASKAGRDLGFSCQLTVADGLKWLIGWWDAGHDQLVKADVDRFEDELVALYRKWEKEIAGKLS
jgi:nucleoside-diphosphate-sugar epimerase